MRPPSLTVIIPIYNGARYLRDCLHSILQQEMAGAAPLEIICVNDGSQDDSLSILQEFARDDERITIINQTNAGAAAARNAGLALATGDYLLFFDGDDLLAPKALSKLATAASATGADLVTCSINYRQEPEGHCFLALNSPDRDLLAKAGAHDPRGWLTLSPTQLARNIMRTFIGWPWDKLIRRQFVLDHGLRFQELRHSNDAYFIYIAMMAAEQITILDEALITHRCHSNSLSTTRFKAPDCFAQACYAMERKLQELGLMELYRLSFLNFCIDFSLWHINQTEQVEAQQIMVRCAGELLEHIGIPTMTRRDFDEKRLAILGPELIALAHGGPRADYSALKRRIISPWELLTRPQKRRRLGELLRRPFHL